jgi:hypothetical protein
VASIRVTQVLVAVGFGTLSLVSVIFSLSALRRTVTWPYGPVATRSRACGRNACPSTVSWAPRAVRVNSRTRRSFSSAAMRLETACWVIDSSTAASENWPARVRGDRRR